MIGTNFNMTDRQKELLNFVNDKSELNKNGAFKSDILPDFSKSILNKLIEKGIISESNYCNDTLYFLTDKGRDVLKESNL